MKKLVFLLTMILHLKNGFAQAPDTFEGVFYVEQPAVILVLQSSKGDFTGYLSDGQQIIPLKGKTNSDHVLEVEAMMNGVTNKSFASLDAAGNLFMADEQLNMLYFTRSQESVAKVMQGFEQALQLAVASDKPATKEQVVPAGKTDNRYADKKFLHLYTGNGLSEKWAYYLLGNGYFYFRSNTSYLSGDAFTDFSAAMSSNDGGTWSVTKEEGVEYLQLNWNTGEKGKLKISRTNDGYLLNNTKYFLVGLREFE